MSPSLAAKFALWAVAFVQAFKWTEVIACYGSPREYYPGYNPSIDMKKPYQAQDPVVCYVIGSRIEEYSQWQSDKHDTADGKTIWDRLSKTSYHGRKIEQFEQDWHKSVLTSTYFMLLY